MLNEGALSSAPFCRALPGAIHRRGHRLVQTLHAERNVLNHAADEERRRRANVAAAPSGDVLANLLQVDVIVHLGGVAHQVDADLTGILI